MGVGTWHTTAEFKDLKVTQDDKTLLESDFATGVKGWQPNAGKWEAGDGVLKQTDLGSDNRITAGDRNWQDYTLSVQARKTGGQEGFLILFHVKDNRHYGWFNLGGWGNTKSGIQIADGGSAESIGTTSHFTVEPDKWYNIRIELKGLDIKCYVDDKLILQAVDTPSQPTEPLFAAASRVDSTGEVILKVVNTASVPQQIEINLNGVGPIGQQATMEVLQGDPQVVNTVDEPTKIAPTQEKIDDAGTKFTHEFPANSVSVIRLKP